MLTQALYLEIKIPNLAFKETFINKTILILNVYHKENVNKLNQLAGFFADKVINVISNKRSLVIVIIVSLMSKTKIIYI